MSIAALEFIFLDAEAFIAQRFNFGGRRLTLLKEHIDDGRLQLLITDITINEVEQQIRKNLTTELAPLKDFQGNAACLKYVSQPSVKALLQKVDVEAAVANLVEQFHTYLNETKAVTVQTELASAPQVFAKYFSCEPPFESKEKKRYEFPDAFVVSILGQWSQNTGHELFVISGDNGMRKACDSVSGLRPLQYLSNILDHVASDDDRADFVRAEVSARIAEIVTKAKVAFEAYGFWVVDDDGEAEITVTGVDTDIEPEILEFNARTAKVELMFFASFDAHLTYDDPNSGIWDGEEKQMLFVEQLKDTVQREVELSVVVEVSFEGEDSATFAIDSVELVDPSEGFGIETDQSSMNHL